MNQEIKTNKNEEKKIAIGKKIFFVAIALIFFVFLFAHKKENTDVKTIDFKIEKGANVWSVGKDLKKSGLIDSRLKFVFQIYKSGKQKKIKAGEYLLATNLSTKDIIEMITAGNTVFEKKQKKITFPEGWTDKQIAEKLAENGFDKEKFLELTKKPEYFQKKYGYEFLKSVPKSGTLEGFLFPDTYFFADNSDAENIIKKMLDNFDKKLTDNLREEIKKQGKSVYEIITMASILEREVRSDADRKIVSGIFWKRLKNGQAFQSCATLAYILGENKKQYSYEDTQIKSPYNTYLHTGLPPGPISNPGLSSILAAIYPTETNYNYFLNNPETGKTVFSVTLEEHNINKVKNGL